ncbi:MAG: lactonase family protein, partial [Actinomycetia bacterium]|nr:lactonase family protein [Actinomycetes bacterium]
LYVLNQNDSTISGYDIGNDGLLTELAASPFNTVAGLTTFPLSLEITSDGTATYLYTTDNNGDITQSTINGAGTPTLIGAGSVNGPGANYRGLVGSPDADHLYVIDQGLDEVHTWNADGTGALEWHPTLGRVRVAGNHLNVALLPSVTTPIWGTSALYAAVKSGNAAQLTVDGTGAMDPITPLLVPTTSDTEALVVHPDHDMVYVTNPGDATNPVMSIPIQGDLSLDGASLAGSAAVGNQANFMALTPGGDHALVLAQTGTLSAYPIGATGLLGAQGASVVTGTIPLGVAVDATGQNAYVANFGSNTVSLYDLDLATGALAAKAPATVAAGSSVRAVATHPSGRYVYATAMGAAGPGGDLIGQYVIDPADGQLILNTPPSVGAGADPGPMACTPNGSFLLVGTSAAGSASIDVYEINTDPTNLTNDGTLTGPVSTAAVPDVAQAITISADGSTVYVGSNTAGTIQAFSISATGVLTPLDGETIGGVVRDVGVRTTMQ